MLRASLAQADITPVSGTEKIGAGHVVVGHRVLDPLFAKVFILENDDERIALVELDVLGVGRKHVAKIRERVEQTYGFPGARIMVAGTHNHGGPAIIRAGAVRADLEYVAHVTEVLVRLFGEALERLEPAEIAIGAGVNLEVARNRRMVLRDGSVRTQATFHDPDALYVEGPVDPAVTTIAVRSAEGRLLGCVVNYACHPTHHHEDDVFSAGWPGVVAREMQQHGFPVVLFLNGALGNVLSDDRLQPDAEDMEGTGRSVARSAIEIVERSEFRDDARIGATSERLLLDFRDISETQRAGERDSGDQAFIDEELQRRLTEELFEEIATKGIQQAEIQVMSIDELSLIGMPCELFCEAGLEIKQRTFPRRAVIVGLANGLVGYVPTRDAFRRGGYETSLTVVSKLALDTSDLLVDAAVRVADTSRATA